jgi:5-dehydro-4-deoxyglucarate dehydratase
MHLSGLLFFPVTPFDAAGDLDLDALEVHVDRGVDAGAGAVFTACGTGEFHALSAAEHEAVVRTTVRVVGGRIPVLAGCGGPLGHATEIARAAERAEADGLLVLPPYLVQAPPAGLVAYVRAIAAATSLPLVAYSRGNAVFSAEAAHELARIPTVVGLKDGHGDLELLASIRRSVSEVRDDFMYFNGLPTAEASMVDYRARGVALYSSATFAFAPRIALGFLEALEMDDHDRVESLLETFYRPFVALRDECPGYAVALVKAGVRLSGLDAGDVRAPLVMPPPEHVARLDEITTAGLRLCASFGDVPRAGATSS